MHDPRTQMACSLRTRTRFFLALGLSVLACLPAIASNPDVSIADRNLEWLAPAPLSDEPARGEWDFALQKEWEIDEIDGQPFQGIAEPLILKGGQLHVRDFGNNVSYLFDDSGKLITPIGRHGEGPSELSRYINRFAAGDKLVLGAPDALHFYSAEGRFLHSAPNNLFERFPLLFLGEDAFIYAPPEEGSSESQPKLVRADLTSGDERVLVDFEPSATGDSPSDTEQLFIQVVGLTPSVLLDGDTRYLYFGKNHTYTIHVTDLEGKRVRSFALDRDAAKVSVEEKKEHFAQSSLTPDQIGTIVAGLPNRLTHFTRIQVEEGLIYVFTTSGIQPRHHRQDVDIFSIEGEYLYRGSFSFGEDRYFGGPGDLLVAGEFLYAILHSQDETRIFKYRIKKPAR